eukprot:3295383-Prymnesium_polylepis.1
MSNDLSTIKEGINVLRSEKLKTAADGLKGLLHQVPNIFAMEAGAELDTEMHELLDVARQVQHDADGAFNTLATPGEKIRAVVIACAALEVSAAGGRAAQSVRTALGTELEKLFSLDAVRRDVAHQLGESRGYLDFPGDRAARLQSTIGVLVHAEAFAASHGLPPITHEFVAEDRRFSLRTLVRSGLFHDRRTVPGLEGYYSPKELRVVGGLCDAPR